MPNVTSLGSVLALHQIHKKRCMKFCLGEVALHIICQKQKITVGNQKVVSNSSSFHFSEDIFQALQLRGWKISTEKQAEEH